MYCFKFTTTFFYTIYINRKILVSNFRKKYVSIENKISMKTQFLYFEIKSEKKVANIFLFHA